MNKDNVLLTTEEWMKLWKEYSEADLLPSIDWAETLLRSQLKKIIEWSNSKCTEHPLENPYLCPDCIEKIRKLGYQKIPELTVLIKEG